MDKDDGRPVAFWPCLPDLPDSQLDIRRSIYPEILAFDFCECRHSTEGRRDGSAIKSKFLHGHSFEIIFRPWGWLDWIDRKSVLRVNFSNIKTVFIDILLI
jgi:hypothetical protein